jgi:competence protein ComEC
MGFPSTHALDPWLRKVPLAGAAAGMWLGAALGNTHPGPWALPLTLVGSTLSLLARRPLERLFALFGLAVGIGALAGGLTQRSTRCPTAGEKRQTVAKLLHANPEPGGRVSLDLLLGALVDPDADQKPSPLRCHALLSSGRRSTEALEGDTVWIPAVDWEPVAHLYNPGDDTAEGLETRGVDRVGSVADGAGILPIARGDPFMRAIARLRRRVRREIDLLPVSPGREILAAVFLGERAALSATTRDSFLDSGLRHFLTDGTLYLAVTLALGLLAARFVLARWEGLIFRWPLRRLAAALCVPLPALYATVTGGSPAATRASVMATLWLATSALGRGRPSALHLMSVAVIVLLGLSPADSGDPGLWLSASALLFISAFTGPLLRRLRRKRSKGRLHAKLTAAVAVAVTIWLATLPVLAEENQRLAYLGIPTSLLGLPLGVGMAASGSLFLTLMASGSRFVSWSAALPLHVALICADALASLSALAAPYSRWIVARPSGPMLAVYVGGLAALAAGVRFGRRAMPVLALCITTLLVCAALVRALSPLQAPLRLTFLSVGQGDGVVIELPNGQTLVLDAGGSPVGSFDPGERVVAPFLWSRGYNHLEAVVLSHPHPDHANGLPYLLSRFDVGELWQSGEPCALSACDEMERLSLIRGIARRRLGTEPFRRDFGAVSLTLLWPRSPLGYDPDLGENDNSLVFRLTYGSFSALLPGDIEADAEAALLSTGVDLRSDVLKAPHHGSDTSSTQSFVDGVQPRDVVFSVGPRNRFGFPRPSVVSRYASMRARMGRTDLDGAITFISDGVDYRRETAAPAKPEESL